LLDLLVEFERLPRRVSPNVEHYEVIYPGLPKRSRCGDPFGGMHCDSMTPQDRSAYLARSPGAIDEENLLIGKSRAATKWRAIHRTLPKRARPLQEGGSSKVCAESGGEST
jgi:hypothetical protein